MNERERIRKKINYFFLWCFKLLIKFSVCVCVFKKEESEFKFRFLSNTLFSIKLLVNKAKGIKNK